MHLASENRNMPTSISTDFRRRVINAYNEGEGTYPEIARRFNVSVSSVIRWVHLERYTDDLSPKKQPPKKRKIEDDQLPLLKEIVLEKPDRTVTEVMQEWNKRFQTLVSRATIGQALLRAGLSFKKNFYGRGARTWRCAGFGSSIQQRNRTNPSTTAGIY